MCSSPCSESRPDPLSDLTPLQREAVVFPAGPLAVIAGPGTGKTRVLTHRIAHLIRERGVDPASIAAVTFTTRAADELRSRLTGLLGDAASRIFAGTFHAFGLSLLRRFRPRTLRVAGDDELAAAAAELRPAAARETIAAILREKERGLSADEVAVHDPELGGRYARYEAFKEARGVLDLPDLILKPVELLRADPAAAAAVRATYPWILVDEFQDVNPAQRELLACVGGEGQGTFVIGDPNQAIYGFRGALAFALDALKRTWPGIRLLALETNFRSTRPIVEAAKHVLSADGKALAAPLAAARDAGPGIVLAALPTPEVEAAWVVRAIERLMGGTSHYAIDAGLARDGSPDLSFGDIAILYRLNAQGEAFEERLRTAGLPYRRLRPLPPAADASARALLAELGERLSASDDAAKLALALQGRELAEGAREIVRRAERFAGTVGEFLASVAILRPDDAYLRGAHISLMTMHAAKGLEFEAVFVVGAGAGVVPYPGAEEEDEERRLLYVAMTRARSRLFVSHFARGNVAGAVASGAVSPFLMGLSPALLAPPEVDPRGKRRRQTFRQLDLFK